MEHKENERVRVTFRIDKNVYDQIKKLAKEDKRTINNYIEVLFSNHLNQLEEIKKEN